MSHGNVRIQVQGILEKKSVCSHPANVRLFNSVT